MHKGSYHTERAKQAISKSLKGVPKTKEHNKKISEAHKKRFRENPNLRLKYVGDKNPAKQPGVGAKISKARMKHVVTKEVRKKISKSLTGRKQTKEHKEHIKYALNNSDVFLKAVTNKEKCKKQSISMKKKWRKDKEYRKKAMITSCNNLFAVNRPTSIEIQVYNILEKHKPSEWLYIGLGQFILEGMNPDFIHANKNIVIEVNGDYWHTEEEAKNRVNKFKKIGYQCIVIWQHDLQKEEAEIIVLSKIGGI